MSGNMAKPNLLLVILAVLLVAALAVSGWLYTVNTGLKEQVSDLESQLTTASGSISAGESALTDAEQALADKQAQLDSVSAELVSTQEELKSTQEALAAVTQEKDQALKQVAELNAALEESNARLDHVTAEKEKADDALAALGFARIEQPAEKAGAAQEPADEAAEADMHVEEPADEPAVEEIFSEKPAEAYVAPAFTLYKSNQLKVSFEAPEDWIYYEDPDTAGNVFSLREETKSDGVYTRLTLITVKLTDAPADDQVSAFLAERYGADASKGDPVELLGAEGLSMEVSLESEAGVKEIRCIHVAVLDGTLYAAEIAAAPAWFDSAKNSVFLPVCASLRIIP